MPAIQTTTSRNYQVRLDRLGNELPAERLAWFPLRETERTAARDRMATRLTRNVRLVAAWP